MKKVFILLIAGIIAGGFMSCKKFLETEPKNAVPDDVTIYDKASAETAIRGAYRQLGAAGYYGQTYVTLGFFPGGNIVNNTTGGGQNVVAINFRSDDPLFNSSWTAIYAAINRANHIIEKVPGVSDPLLTQALKDQIRGEAYFIRALAYFDLARAWGGVQLVLTPTTSPEPRNIPRSSLADTYAQVHSDLNQAEALLPNTVNRVRATRKTVWALRARLYLYQENWAQAETEATKLISDASYSLLTPFNRWFANNVTATNESIFEVAFSTANQNTIRSEMQHPTKGGTYRFAPTVDFVNKLKTPSIGGTATGRRALIDSVTQGSTTLWYGNLYYRSPATDPAYVLRIAEQYLIRAEARAKLGNYTDALDDINAVRTRAGLVSSVSADEASLLNDVENERRYEFALEAHAYFDLARTGRLRNYRQSLDPLIQVDTAEYRFPIPITQVQLDPSLSQNPGY